MTKFNTIMNSLSKGMLSKNMRGRTDSKDYMEGAELVQNFLGYKQGGAYRRPGTQFISAHAQDTYETLIPLPDGTFITEVAGVLGLMTSDGTFTTSSLNLSYGKESDNTTLTLGTVVDYMTIGDITIITRYYKEPLVVYKGSGVSGSVFVTKTKIHLLSQVIDVDVPFSPIFSAFYNDKNAAKFNIYEIPNIVAGKTITPTGTTGTIQLNTSFKLTKTKGSYIKITHGAVTGVAFVTSNDLSPLGTPGVYDAEVVINFGATTASDNFQISVTHKLQYMTYFQQRVVFGVEARLFGTLVGSLQHLMVRRLAQDSSSDASGINYFGDISSLDPFDFTISSKDKSSIQWLQSGENLEAGTDLNEIIGFGGNGEILSSLNANLPASTSFGSSDVRPVKTNKSTISVSSDGYALREFVRSANTTSFNTRQLNLISEEIQGNTPFKQLVLQKGTGAIWLRTEDGQLVTCVYHEEIDVISWAIHDIGGTVQTIVPYNSDEIYLLVERTINSTTYQYLEMIDLPYKGSVTYPVNSETHKPFMMDSAVYTKLGTPNNVVTGLSHLEGESVDVWVDGVLEEGLTVSSGQVTTTNSGEEFFVGLPYISKIITMPIEAGQAFGTAQGSIKRIHEIFVKFYKTIGGSVGDKSKTYPLSNSDGVNLLTDDIEKKVDISPAKNNQIVIEQNKSLPMSILGVVYKGVTYDQ